MTHIKLLMKFYAVKVGRGAPVITNTWDECNSLVNGFSGAIFKSFSSRNDALAFLYDKDLEKEEAKEEAKEEEQANKEAEKEANKEANKEAKDVEMVEKAEKVKKVANQSLDVSNIYFGQKGDHKNIIKQRLTFLKEDYEFIVYTDGSCLNQGSADKNLWSSGSGIYIPKIDLKIGLKIDGTQTNNRAELYPIIWILECIYEIFFLCSENKEKQNTRIVINSDSTYAMNVYGNNQKNLELWSLLKSIINRLEMIGVQVLFVKALAHSGIYGNEMADRIADFMATYKI
jgi:ribonuclease HI